MPWFSHLGIITLYFNDLSSFFLVQLIFHYLRISKSEIKNETFSVLKLFEGF